MSTSLNVADVGAGGWKLLTWGAIALGVWFRVSNLEKKVYSDDEAHTSLWISGHSKNELRTSFADREVAVHELQSLQTLNPERGALHTVAVLAEGDPQHPPLYYLLVRLWVHVFGDSIPAIRSFSVLAGLLVLPAVYWLCRELFGSDALARLATALVALSPFHVLYAQEAREYSLWTLTVLLSSIAVWRASKAPTTVAWGLYSAAVVLGLYTHTLTLLVMLAHGAYIAARCSKQDRSRQGHIPSCTAGYTAASLAALVAFAPWLRVVAANLSEENFAASSWGSLPVAPWRLLGMWGFNFSTLFFDADNSLKFVEGLDAGVWISYLIQALALVIAGCALYHLWRRAPWEPRVFLLSMLLVPAVALALPDLILGGMRSGGGNRYFVPSYLGVAITVAYLLVTRSRSEAWQRRAGRSAVASLLLVLGLVSCVLISQAETWWIKSTAYYTPRISRIINSAQQPLLIAAVSPLLLTFSHSLDEDTRLWIVQDPHALRIPDGFSEIFVHSPSESLIDELARQGQQLETVDARGSLYRLSVCRSNRRRPADLPRLGQSPDSL